MKNLKKNRLRQLVQWGYMTQPQANEQWKRYLRFFKQGKYQGEKMNQPDQNQQNQQKCEHCGRTVGCDYHGRKHKCECTRGEIKCKDHCPKCNSQNIFWEVMENGDNVAYQPATCNDCGCTFKEYWKYSDTEISDD